MFDQDDNQDDYQDDIEQTETEMVDDEQDIDDGQDDQDSQDESTDDPAAELDFSFDEPDENSDPFAGQEAPDWVKQVRKENRELKRQLKSYEQSQPQQQGLREKPTLDSHDYDSEAYEQDYAQWLTEKQQYDAAIQSERAKYEQYDTRYHADVDAVRASASDYDDVEQLIVDTLPPQRQAVIKMMADNPARLVYALGKSPNKLQALSELDDTQFIKQIVLMEQQMAAKKGRNPSKPKPQTHELEGGAGGADSTLAKLEAEADRTGDRSKLVAYKKQMRNKRG